ncbi:DNA-binding protein WhiA [Mycoplasma sp. Z386]
MSFTHEIKMELIENKMKEKQFKSFLKGLIFTNCQFNNNDLEVVIKINRADISMKIKEKLDKFKIKFYRSIKNKNWIIILKKDIDLELVINEPAFFFAGAFLGGGTISGIDSTSYHLEISYFEEKIGNLMIKKLNNYEFNFISKKRKNKFFIYEKKVNNILDFLSAIRANTSFLKFFNLKNERDIENNANRLANLDFHNQQRLVNASQRDIKNYLFLKENNLVDQLTDDQVIFFEIRVKFPYLHLNEIVEILKEEHNIIKTKGGLNHWSIKLAQIVSKYKAK